MSYRSRLEATLVNHDFYKLFAPWTLGSVAYNQERRGCFLNWNVARFWWYEYHFCAEGNGIPLALVQKVTAALADSTARF